MSDAHDILALPPDELAEHLRSLEAADSLVAAAGAHASVREHGALPSAAAWAAGVAAACWPVALAWLSVTHGAFVPWLWEIDLGVHEFGHMVMFWAPTTIVFLAGSGFQVAVPVALAAYFLVVRRETLGASLCAGWAGMSARNVALYIADAPFQRLDLWGGENSMHDWAYLLGGHLQLAAPLAAAVEAFAWLAFATALALALAPLVIESRRALAERAAERAFESRRTSLPVREPHGPLG